MELRMLDQAAVMAGYAVYRDCMYLPTPEKYTVKMQRYLQDPRSKVYGCFVEGVLCGMLVLRLNSAATGELVGIAVDAACRKHGRGRAMINAVIKRHGLRVLVAETDDDAVGFYQNCGFCVQRFEENFGNHTAVRYRCEWWAETGKEA